MDAEERRRLAAIATRRIKAFLQNNRIEFTGAGEADLPQVQLVFYSLFSSHVEVHTHVRHRRRGARRRAVPPPSPCACLPPRRRTARARQAALLYDWLSNMRNDFSLRLNLNRLRSGLYDIASRDPNAPLSQREAREVVQQGREHAQ